MKARPLGLAQVLGELETTQGRRVGYEVVDWRLDQPVVIPPLWLGVAPVPVEEGGEQPAALLLVRPLGPVGRDALAQRFLASPSL